MLNIVTGGPPSGDSKASTALANHPDLMRLAMLLPGTHPMTETDIAFPKILVAKTSHTRIPKRMGGSNPDPAGPSL